jgi:hypothetical protein
MEEKVLENSRANQDGALGPIVKNPDRLPGVPPIGQVVSIQPECSRLWHTQLLGGVHRKSRLLQHEKNYVKSPKSSLARSFGDMGNAQRTFADPEDALNRQSSATHSKQSPAFKRLPYTRLLPDNRC